jgi:hypothetical protein
VTAEGQYLPVVVGQPRDRTVPNGVYSLSAEVIDEFFHLIKTGYGKYKAADLLGLTWDEVADAIDVGEGLAARFDHARQVRLDEVEEALYGSAVAGNVAAQKLVLVNQRPAVWSEGQTLVKRLAPLTNDTTAEDEESARGRAELHSALMGRIEDALTLARADEEEVPRDDSTA